MVDVIIEENLDYKIRRLNKYILCSIIGAINGGVNMIFLILTYSLNHISINENLNILILIWYLIFNNLILIYKYLYTLRKFKKEKKILQEFYIELRIPNHPHTEK